jgi:hypothetical protein
MTAIVTLHTADGGNAEMNRLGAAKSDVFSAVLRHGHGRDSTDMDVPFGDTVEIGALAAYSVGIYDPAQHSLREMMNLLVIAAFYGYNTTLVSKLSASRFGGKAREELCGRARDAVFGFGFVRDALLTALTEMSPAVATQRVGVRAIHEWARRESHDFARAVVEALSEVGVEGDPRRIVKVLEGVWPRNARDSIGGESSSASGRPHEHPPRPRTRKCSWRN